MFRGIVSAISGRSILNFVSKVIGRRIRLQALTMMLAMFYLAVGYAQGQTAQAGASRLESVSVTGSARFSSEQIAAAIGLKRGEMIQRDDLQGAADKLAELGLFSNIQYRFSTEPGGVKVTYEVSDVPLVPVTFDNFLWLTDEELFGGLKSSGILFDGAAPLKGTVLDAISGALVKLLDAHGIHGRVTHEAVAIPAEDRTIQQFRVEDVDLTVQGVEFSDPLAKSDRAIQERLADIVGKPYSRGRMELFEFEQVRPVYLAHSYLQVQFKRPAAHFASAQGDALTGKVIVDAHIDPGPAYHWAGVEWHGNSAVPSQSLNALVEMMPGDAADGNKIQAIWERAREAYSHGGYLDAALNASPQFDEKSGRVTYSVTITEGPQYHMGNLVLTGLSMEGERRIRKAWALAPGAVFDKSVYEDFVNGGITAAFTGLPVHYDKIGKFLQPDPKEAKVDVLLDFQ